MTIEKQLPLIEEILSEYKACIGGDFDAYRNHVYRVINLCFSLGQFSAIEKEKIQLAGCFHDIGIWTAGTLDYLPPSESEASRYLNEKGLGAWNAEITEMIAMHHCICSCKDSSFALVEAFRRADIADFSLGVVAIGIPAALIAQTKAAFPNAGFHMQLLRLGTKWLFRHPLNPLPMFRR
ncbi:MAG: hypothetical protein IPH08_18305 [Rhodocyclaceae bacterium]|jgi:hypothetical protein|nr:hypothetical protein [Rhodocyclaceae bacterium]